MREYVKTSFDDFLRSFLKLEHREISTTHPIISLPAQSSWRGYSERSGNSFDRVVFNMNGKKIKIHLTERADYFTGSNNLKQ